MDKILVKRFEIPTDPVKALVVGFPGLGLVGATAARMLLQGEDGPKAGLALSFHPYSLMGNVRSSRSAMTTMQAVKLHHKPLSEPKGGIFILTATSQPPEDLQYELAWTVIGEAKLLGCTTILTLGGYQTPTVTSSRRVYFCSNDLHSYRVSTKLGFEIFEGPITGAAGVFAGVGKFMGLSGGCMLGETSGEGTPDGAAAAAVASALMAFLLPNAPTNDHGDIVRNMRRGRHLDSLS